MIVQSDIFYDAIYIIDEDGELLYMKYSRICHCAFSDISSLESNCSIRQYIRK